MLNIKGRSGQRRTPTVLATTGPAMKNSSAPADARAPLVSNPMMQHQDDPSCTDVVTAGVSGSLTDSDDDSVPGESSPTDEVQLPVGAKDRLLCNPVMQMQHQGGVSDVQEPKKTHRRRSMLDIKGRSGQRWAPSFLATTRPAMKNSSAMITSSAMKNSSVPFVPTPM